MAQKKNSKKVSSKTALIMSSVLLTLCVGILFLTVSITATAQSPEQKDDGRVSQIEEIVLEPVDEQIEATNIPEKKSESVKTAGKKNDGTFPAETKPSVSPKIYIILDDGGHNLEQLQCFLDLPFPVTVAVLPELSHSAESARNIVDSGKTLMLHQPMQALNLSVNPGPGAIEPGMSEIDAISIVSKNIENVTSMLKESEKSKLVGMNNHEGSLITENPELMRAVMQFCKEQGVFFLDSRTTAKSVCPSIAKEIDVQFYERNIFLDNEPEQEKMIAQFRKGVSVARKNGSVIMIGHVWSGKNLADVLQKMYSEYSSQGFEFRSF